MTFDALPWVICAGLFGVLGSLLLRGLDRRDTAADRAQSKDSAFAVALGRIEIELRELREQNNQRHDEYKRLFATHEVRLDKKREDISDLKTLVGELAAATKTLGASMVDMKRAVDINRMVALGVAVAPLVAQLGQRMLRASP